MIKLATKHALLVSAGIQNLGGFQKAVGESVAFIPYSFTDATRKKIRKLKNAVKPIVEGYQEDHKALVIELSPVNEDTNKEVPEIRKQYRERNKALTEAMCEIDAETLNLDGELLRDNKNPIPDDVLDALDSVLTQEPKAEKKPEVPGGE